MGKFDRTLEGEKKLRGVKRKFDPIEKSVEAEKSANLELVRKIESGHRSSKRAKQDAVGEGTGDRSVLNVRKAVRFASGGKGAVALARKSTAGADSRQKRRGKR